MTVETAVFHVISRGGEARGKMSAEDAIRAFVACGDDLEKQNSLYMEVLEASGYRLPVSRDVSCSETEKSDVLERINKDWKRYEKKYKQSQRKQMHFTRCKSTRNSEGYLEYTDTVLGTMIHHTEYEARYYSYKDAYRLLFRQKYSLGTISPQRPSPVTAVGAVESPVQRKRKSCDENSDEEEQNIFVFDALSSAKKEHSAYVQIVVQVTGRRGTAKTAIILAVPSAIARPQFYDTLNNLLYKMN